MVHLKWFVFLTVLISVLWLGVAVAEDKQITVVLRYDDFSARPERTAFERKLIEVFRKHDVPVTYGVIPYVCAGDWSDPHEKAVLPLNILHAEFLLDLVAAGKLEVALHGCFHRTLRAESPHGEFAGLSLSEQIQRITRGKNHLEQLLPGKITTFIPPWNKYDSNTLRALEHCGIPMLSAAKFVPEESAELLVLPVTCDLSSVRDAVKAARESTDSAPVIVVLFHGHDFRELDEERGILDFDSFSELLQWIDSQEDVVTRLLRDVLTSRKELNFAHFSNYGSVVNGAVELLPPVLRPGNRLLRFAYPTPSELSRIKRGSHIVVRLVLWLGALLLMSATTVVLAGRLGLFKIRILVSLLAAGTSIALVGCSIYALRDADLGYRAIAPFPCLIGLLVGLMGYKFGSRTKSPPEEKTSTSG